MARIARGAHDPVVDALLGALNDYEGQFSGSEGSSTVRIPAPFACESSTAALPGMPRSRRHDDVWQFLSQRLDEDVMSEVSTLLLLPPAELGRPWRNMEFEDPVPSSL